MMHTVQYIVSNLVYGQGARVQCDAGIGIDEQKYLGKYLFKGTFQADCEPIERICFEDSPQWITRSGRVLDGVSTGIRF
jgi:hypothetical protein